MRSTSRMAWKIVQLSRPSPPLTIAATSCTTGREFSELSSAGNRAGFGLVTLMPGTGRVPL